MRVQTSSPSVRHVTEKAFEKRLKEVFDGLGSPFLKMNSHDKGWPDRYLGQGKWAELKSVALTRAENYRSFMGWSPEQKAMGKILRHGGDIVYGITLVQLSHYAPIILVQRLGHTLVNEWSLETLVGVGYKYETDEMVKMVRWL